MERKTKLAFLLIAVILIVNIAVMEMLAPPRQQPGATDSLVAVPVPPPPAHTAAPSDLAAASPTDTTSTAATTGALFPFAADAREIQIETPLQRLRISLAGAVLTEVSLMQHLLANDQPVDLLARPAVDRGAGSALGLLLYTRDGEIDVRQAQFTLLEALTAGGPVVVDAATGPRTLTFRAQAQGGGAVLKRFTIAPDRYDIQVDLDLERGGRLQQIEAYTLEWTRGLPVTEIPARDDLASFKLFIRHDKQVTAEGIGAGFWASMTGRAPKGEKVVERLGAVEWLAMKSKYFAVALVPETLHDGKARLRADQHANWMGLELAQPQPWRERTRETYRVYAGPIVYDTLDAYGNGLEAIVDLGWSWVRPFSSLILAFMKFLHGFIANYGVIIVIISVLSKLVFWPLSEKSFKSMREMQLVQPLMQELRKRYANDPKELNRQMMQLYKQRGVNPMGGCMPLLVQMPIFVALYSVLRSNIELRNAPFFLWIDNLAAPDVLFHLPFTIPFLGQNFSLLPLLMGVAMIWQSKMGSPMAMSGPAAQQQAIMKWVMPIVFIFIFYSMPSGLVLYWLINTVLSVWQQIQINRKYAVAPAMSPPVEAKTETPGRSNNGAQDRAHGSKRGGRSRTGARGAGGKS